MTERADLNELALAAAAGDRAAAQQVLEAIQGDVYGLSLRMLGHPADAEDAAQEILLIVLTHLGSFRGESKLRTWVWRIAANHLSGVRRGRRETLSFELLNGRLRSGLSPAAEGGTDPEASALVREVRLRCTQAMLLALDREHRIAYLLGDIFQVSGEEGAQVLGIDHASFRKRLSRARARLHEFMREFCGVYDPANPCRCAGQVAAALQRGILAEGDLDLSRQRRRPALQRAVDEVSALQRAAEVLRGPGEYDAPDALLAGLRQLLESGRLELLKH